MQLGAQASWTIEPTPSRSFIYFHAPVSRESPRIGVVTGVIRFSQLRMHFHFDHLILFS